jgi:DNA repair exonuclease SbcCD nuclease subunit
MVTKIVHIADLHFKNFGRNDEYRAVSELFFHKMSLDKPDRIVIAGDIVDSRNQLSPELVNDVAWFLNKCAESCGRVVIIPGNHDLVMKNKERMDAITAILNVMSKDNIDYYKNSGVYSDENISWVVFSLYDNNMHPEIVYDDNIRIGLYHGILPNATSDSGYVFKEGPSLDKFSGCDIVLCGDIHKRQVMKSGDGVVFIMPGSFIQQNFGENITEHGYTVLNLDSSSVEKNNNERISYYFVDIDNPVKYLNFSIKDYEDIIDENEVLINA